MVVGGSVAEWAALSDSSWQERLGDLGKVADHIGASWLTVRPFETTADDAARDAADDTVAPVDRRAGGVESSREMRVGGCDVLASSLLDGRQRLVAALASIAETGEEFTDERIARVLNEPAEVDPDLVLVLGAPDRLPRSIVWELAYSELVYLDVAWAELQPQHLTDAIAAYAHRHRRFGGLD